VATLLLDAFLLLFSLLAGSVLIGKEQGDILPAESAVASCTDAIRLQHPALVPTSHRIDMHVGQPG